MKKKGSSNNEFYQAVSMCPQGKVAIGGSVSCLHSGISNIRPSLVYSAPETNNFQNVGWIGACKGEGSVIVEAICVDPNQVSLYKGDYAEKRSNYNDEFYQAVSMCPKGKIAIGGEVNCVDSGNNIRPSLVYSEPETNNFQNVGWVGACKGKGSVVVGAICVDPNQVSLYKGSFADKKSASNNALPDLTVTDINFTASSMNEEGVLSVTIKNLGNDLNSSAGLMSWYNNFSNQNFIFTNTSNPTISSFTTSRDFPSSSKPLRNNESITFYWKGKFNTHGNLYLQFKVNQNQELSESNYNNNSFSTSIKINQNTSVIPNTPTTPTSDQINNINQVSQTLAQGNIDELLSQINQLRNQVREQEAQIKYLQDLTTELSQISANMQTAINTFITYGVDDNTKRLGAGERAAVVNSYQSAYGKLPNSETELNDIIKIANGRWPSITNNNAENRAKAEFRNIYKREANMNNPNDNAAITIMAYGLRQRAENRNLNSESAGLKTFRAIYKRIPQSTNDWNILQAITYSGATR